MTRAPESADFPLLALVEDSDTEIESTGTDDPKALAKEQKDKINEVSDKELPEIGGYNFLSPVN